MNTPSRSQLRSIDSMAREVLARIEAGQNPAGAGSEFARRARELSAPRSEEEQARAVARFYGLDPDFLESQRGEESRTGLGGATRRGKAERGTRECPGLESLAGGAATGAGATARSGKQAGAWRVEPQVGARKRGRKNLRNTAGSGGGATGESLIRREARQSRRAARLALNSAAQRQGAGREEDFAPRAAITSLEASALTARAAKQATFSPGLRAPAPASALSPCPSENPSTLGPRGNDSRFLAPVAAAAAALGPEENRAQTSAPGPDLLPARASLAAPRASGSEPAPISASLTSCLPGTSEADRALFAAYAAGSGERLSTLPEQEPRQTSPAPARSSSTPARAIAPVSALTPDLASVPAPNPTSAPAARARPVVAPPPAALAPIDSPPVTPPRPDPSSPRLENPVSHPTFDELIREFTEDEDDEFYAPEEAPRQSWRQQLAHALPSRTTVGALLLVIAAISVGAGVVQGYVFGPEPARATASSTTHRPAQRTETPAPSAPNPPRVPTGENTTSATEPARVEGPPSTLPIVVDVKGNVRRPGVVSLAAPARVKDALAAVGGAPEELGNINLARPLSDGELIYVPRAGETAPATDSQSPGKVRLNQADAAELQKLPGVGPALAQRIVDYRAQKGNFKTLAELQRVPGIGERKLAELKGLVTL